MTVEMQQMPGIWDDTTFVTNRSAVLGQLANWAIRQSPYDYPEHLAEALAEFVAAFQPPEAFEVPLGCTETSCQRLRKSIRTAFDACPSILAWNSPKDGSNPDFMAGAFYARERNDEPVPDHDIIDLDALARNMAHSITLAEKYDKVHRQPTQRYA